MKSQFKSVTDEEIKTMMQETIDNLECLAGISEWEYSIEYAAEFEHCAETIIRLRDEMMDEQQSRKTDSNKNNP